jgi:hypothetical protein
VWTNVTLFTLFTFLHFLHFYTFYIFTLLHFLLFYTFYTFALFTLFTLLTLLTLEADNKRMQPAVIFVSDSEAEDDDYIPFAPPPRVLLNPIHLPVLPAVSGAPQVALQNGVRFPGPALPVDLILSAARSSGIFDVGHTCNVTKRSGTSTMARLECSRRAIIHLSFHHHSLQSLTSHFE